MGSPIVLDQPNPLNVASGAAGAYAEARDTRRDKALALAMERQKMASDEDYRNRTLALQTRAQDTADLNSAAERHHLLTADNIAEATEKFRQEMEPFAREAARLGVEIQQKQSRGEDVKIEAEKARILREKAETHRAKVEADLLEKYGPQIQQLAIKKAGQDLVKGAADIAYSHALTYRTMNPVMYGGGGSGGTASERATSSYNQAFQGLSKGAQALAAEVPKMDRVSAMLAIQAGLHKHTITAQDAEKLRVIVTNKETSVLTAGNEATAANKAHHDLQGIIAGANAAKAKGKTREFVADQMKHQGIPDDMARQALDIVFGPVTSIAPGAQQVHGGSIQGLQFGR